jgi:hypothetical protein
VGGYAELQEVGAGPCLPAGDPAQQGGAGRGGQPRRQLELPEWHSSGPMERLATVKGGLEG